jgi:chorismate-pyruvate lyase
LAKKNLNRANIANDQPIGQSLIINEIDTYKEINSVNYGYSYNLEKRLKANKPLWSRKYTMWYNKKPLTMIQEFFSIDLS